MQEFRTRDDAAQAVRARKVGYLERFVTEGGWYIRAHIGSALDDLLEPGEDSLKVQALGEPTPEHYGDDDDTRLARAIAAFNTGEAVNLTASGNPMHLTVAPPPITRGDGIIDGRGTRLNMRGADARFFRAEGPQMRNRRLVIRDFTLAVHDPQNARGAAISADHVTDCHFENLDPVNVPSYFHLIGDNPSTNVTVTGASGSWFAGSDQPIVHLEAGAVVDILRNEIKGGSYSRTASSILIRPRQVMDTVRIYDNAMFAGDGMLHGVDAEMTDFPLTNLWCGGNVFDRAKGSAYRIRARGVANRYMKHLSIRDRWLRSMGGPVIDIENEGLRHDVEKIHIACDAISTGGTGGVRVRGRNAGDATTLGLMIEGSNLQNDGYYIETMEAGVNPVLTFNQTHLIPTGARVMIAGIHPSSGFAALNNRVFEVGAVTDWGLQAIGLNTTGMTGRIKGAMVGRLRPAMIDTNVPGARVVHNLVGARVAAAPQATTAFINRDGAAADLYEAGNVLGPVTQKFLVG